MKTSKVKSCKFLKSYTSKFGEMYSHLITFENGDSGEISAKSEMPDKFSAGRELSYEITPNPNPKYSPKIKAVQNTNGNATHHDSGEVAKLKKDIEDLQEIVKQLVKHTKLVYVAPKPQQPAPTTNGTNYPDDDLPF